MSHAFDRLSPALRYQIVNGLGFRGLRPVQELTIPAVLDGRNCVVLAPTAGGKTEAAFFPLLSKMDTDDWRPISALYVSPIRALLNNQRHRLQEYAELLGRRAAVWHGDTTAAARRAIIQEPVDLLLTTPESLEVMLMSQRVPVRRLFAGLRAVVVDEVHAFVGDDRGGHLAAVLERLCRLCGRDVQRIGLSATVGNPPEILAWMAGSSTRQGQVISPPRPQVEADLTLDYTATLANAAMVVSRLHRGSKRLVFVDSRRGVETLGGHLADAGVETFVLHSSLAKEQRELAEQAFAERSNCVIVATSTLELGVDIGDLDHVLQIDAPRTVASFVQRMGRTGRRAGTRPNCTFLATDDDRLLQAAAILRLHKQGYIEPVRPVRRASHLLAHQMMALSIQERGIPTTDWWGWVGQATPFVDLPPEDREALVRHMVVEDILVETDGRLALGTHGETLYGRRHFAELYAVFSVAETLVVQWGRRVIGSIETSFAQQFDLAELSFTLGARAWQAVGVDWDRGPRSVVPTAAGRSPRWRGPPVLLGREMCEAMRKVLVSRDEDPWWSQRARRRIEFLREQRLDEASAGDALLPDDGGFSLWTWAGGASNNLLAKVLLEQLGERISADNLRIRFRGEAGESAARIGDALAGLREARRPDHQDAAAMSPGLVRARLSKFRACLTESLERRYLASVVFQQ